MKHDDSANDEASTETLAVERRAGKDRRKTDVTTIGPFDRRRTVEQRKMQVVEVEMSESEWEALFGKRRG